jgi:glycosyltransferase involved in cell wall biosynthesis
MVDLDRIICVSSIRWDCLKQRPQQIMQSLSDKSKIIYIEPDYDPIKLLKYRLKHKKAMERIRKINDNLFIVIPLVPFSCRKIPKLHKIIQKYFYFKKLARIAQKLGFENSTLWLYDPLSIDYLGQFKEKYVIYDCLDEQVAFSDCHQKVGEYEQKIISKADVVLTTAQGLYSRISTVHNNVYLVRNGAEYEHFAVPPKQRTSQKVAGFIGAVYDWVDIEMIEYAALKLPHIMFELIGPVKTDIEKLRILSNVVIHNQQAYSILPSFIKRFDVCLIPFKINQLTKNVNPVKLYEYFASGRPVVSTNIPEVAAYKPYVYCVDSKSEFVESILSALNENDENLINERRKIARENSWDARCEQIRRELKK